MSTRARSVSRARPTAPSVVSAAVQAALPARSSAVAPIPSVAYLRAANRFLHLAAGAQAEDEEEREDERAEEGEHEEEAAEEGGERASKGGKKGKKGKKGGKDCPAMEDDDEPEEEASEEEEDDEDEDDEAKRKAIASQARAAERSRWAAVLSSAEAKGRVSLACSLLAETGMSAVKIRSALLASPTETRYGLAARMAEVPRPDVGSGPAARVLDPNSSEGRVAAFKAAVAKATGKELDAA